MQKLTGTHILRSNLCFFCCHDFGQDNSNHGFVYFIMFVVQKLVGIHFFEVNLSFSFFFFYLIMILV